MFENTPFFWGKNGQKLTPDQVAYQRELAEAARGRMGDTSPVGHWTQGAARVVDALGGVLREKRADKAEEAGLASADAYISENSVLGSLLNGGGGRMSSRGTYIPPKAPNPFDEMYPTGKPGPAPEGNVDPASGLDMGTPVNFDLREGIIQTAEAIGADPLDLATAISYETAGTFDPMKAGPTTQWGQHRGLIQFGEPQAGQYGVDFSSPEAALASQLGPDGAVAKYFKSSGFQPGMPGIDLYSTINAGAPGRYSASDANNGGAAGDVADKWNNQMEGHRAKAAALLGGEYVPASGGREVLAAQNAPGGQNVISVLAEAMSNPWVAKKYGPVIGALMDQQMKRSDMDYQAQLKQQDPMYQAQLAAMQNPQPDLTSAQREYEMAKQQGFTGSFLDYKTALAEAGRAQTNVTTNVGGGPEMGKLSTDYGYVLDPVTNQPVIDPDTGLPKAAPVPGSPAAQEIASASEKTEEKARQSEIKMGTMLENIGLNIEEINDGGFPVTGFFGRMAAKVPGTPAADFDARTTQINTRAALDEVQNMRDNSPTGGAVGQLTDSEREAIGLAATSLSSTTSAKEYLRAAEKFRKTVLDIAHGEGNWRIDESGRLFVGPQANDDSGWTDVGGVKIRVKQ